MTPNSPRKPRKWLGIAIGILTVSAIAISFAFIRPHAQQSAASISLADGNEEIVTAFLGDLSSTATATGEIQARREAQLSLAKTGTVGKIFVREGDKVEEGDVLVQLETAALKRAVASARQNLVIQEATLTDLQNGASSEEITSAQAAVASAQATLEDVLDGADPNDIAAARANLASAQAAYAALRDGPDANDIAQAEANLRNAEASLQKAQADYDEVSWRPDIGSLPQSLALEQATNSYNVALAAYNTAIEGASDEQIKQAQANVAQAQATLQKLLDSPTDTEIAAAKSQLAQAQATLASLQEGASDEKIAIAQAQVEQARINLQDALENLDKASLLAPFDGVITAVYVTEGEIANGPAIDIADTNNLEVVLSVDEVDIGDLAVGQPAVITLETWPDQEIIGEIVSISPKATVDNSAIVSYEVRLSLDEIDLPIRIGMTAEADLITAAKKNVLLVPTQAITPNRAAGTYTVNLVETGPDGRITTRTVEVTTGLKDGAYTEITGGLQEGDQLALKVLTTNATEQPGGLFDRRPRGIDRPDGM